MGILKKCYKVLIIGLLCVALAFQALVLGLYCPYKGWLSPLVFRVAQYYLAKQGLDLGFADFQLGPGGSIHLQTGLCSIGQDRKMALSIKDAHLSLQLSGFKNPFRQARLSLKDLSVYDKADDSRPVMSLQHLEISWASSPVNIDRGQLVCGPLSVQLGGILDVKHLKSKTKQSVQSLGDKEGSFSLLRDFQKYLEAVDQASGWAGFELDERGSHLNFVLAAHTAHNKHADYLPEAYVRGLFHFYTQEPHSAWARWECSASSYTLGQNTLKAATHVTVSCSDLSQPHTLQVEAYGQALSIGGEPALAYLHASLKKIDGPWIHLNLKGVEGKAWIASKLQVNIQDHALLASVRASLDEAIFQKSILKPYFPEKSYLKQPLATQAKVVFGPGYVFQVCEGTLQVDSCCVIDIPLHHLRANFAVSPAQIALTDVSFQHPNCTGEGAYYQNLSNDDYRFLLNGSLDPHLITPVMDPWWKDLWVDFDLAAWPKANLDVQGNWAQQSTSFVYGYAEAAGFVFRKAVLDSCNLYFWAAPLYLQLFDMHLVSQSQKAEVLIDWMYAPEDPDNYYAIVFEAQSELSLSTLALLLASKDVDDLSKSFEMNPPPILSGQGILYGHPAAPKEDHMRLHCKLMHPLSYEGIPLEYLSLDVHKKGLKTEVSSLLFGLAGGKAQGSLVLDSQPPQPQLSFDISLDEADYDALRTLTQYKDHFRAPADTPAPQGEDRPHPIDVAEASLEASKVGGLATLKAKGRGTLGVFNSFVADGAFKLKGADLGQIHILGQLSRVLKLGSFDFKNLKAEFDLDAGILTVPSLDIWGNTARLDGKGRYSLIEDALDFSLHFYALGGLKLPLFSQLIRWIDPVSKVSFIKLQGSLKEPEWKIKLSPFAFLK